MEDRSGICSLDHLEVQELRLLRVQLLKEAILSSAEVVTQHCFNFPIELVCFPPIFVSSISLSKSSDSVLLPDEFLHVVMTFAVFVELLFSDFLAVLIHVDSFIQSYNGCSNFISGTHPKDWYKLAIQSPFQLLPVSMMMSSSSIWWSDVPTSRITEVWSGVRSLTTEISIWRLGCLATDDSVVRWLVGWCYYSEDANVLFVLKSDQVFAIDVGCLAVPLP